MPARMLLCHVSQCFEPSSLQFSRSLRKRINPFETPFRLPERGGNDAGHEGFVSNMGIRIKTCHPRVCPYTPAVSGLCECQNGDATQTSFQHLKARSRWNAAGIEPKANPSENVRPSSFSPEACKGASCTGVAPLSPAFKLLALWCKRCRREAFALQVVNISNAAPALASVVNKRESSYSRPSTFTEFAASMQEANKAPVKIDLSKGITTL